MRWHHIAAVSRDGYLADTEGSIPWHLPRDQAHFRQAVGGKVILLGRKTAVQMHGWFTEMQQQSLGVQAIVLSRKQPPADFAGLAWVPDFSAAKQVLADCGAEDVWVCGGGQIYTLTLPHAEELIISEIDLEVGDGIAYPRLHLPDWQRTVREQHPAHADQRFSFDIVHYQRLHPKAI